MASFGFSRPLSLVICRLEATRITDDQASWHRLTISSKSKFLLVKRNFYQG
jgi:hypothetical protein